MKLYIFDFGSRFTKDVVEIVSDHNVDYELVNHDYAFSDDFNALGIIVTGSKDSVYDDGRRCDERFFELGIPILGICYGHQLANDVYGGVVQKSKTAEFDKQVTLHIIKDNPIFKGIKDYRVGMYHYDEVVKLGDGFENIAYSDDCKFAATYNKDKNIYTLQFHPEDRKYSVEYNKYFTNFFDICGIEYK